MCVFEVLIFVILIAAFQCTPCAERSYGEGNVVCVCNLTYCDELELLTNIEPGQAALYETNAKGSRFKPSVLQFLPQADPGVPILSLNTSQMMQFILGFGGAFTDAAGINIRSLPLSLQKLLMASYFTDTGLQYNMGRVPIASCDFSTHPYSYDEFEGDFNLTKFSLAKEDFAYKIPLIHEAQALLGQQELLLVSSPWSAPAWMKTNGQMKGKGEVKGDPGGQYYKTWADYLVKFVKSYAENNITMWGMTVQNEPTDGCIEDFRFQAMCFPADRQRDFLKLDLGPKLKSAGLTPEKLKLLIVDDDRFVLPKWADVILEDKASAQYVSGIAFHWYFEGLASYKLLDVTHRKHPEMFLLSTEACTGSYPWEFPKVALGDFSRAERYAHDIAQDLLNWSVGWLDWNLALDFQGGPNWVKNYVDAPIIANAPNNEFIKQPMYYALAHFSKCITRGSVRVGINSTKGALDLENKLDLVAFVTPQNKNVLISINRNDVAEKFFLHEPSKGFLNVTVPPHSIQSLVW